MNDIRKQDYGRQQFGGSVGGPIVPNKAHYFAAYERTQQDTQQVVNTLGLFPSEDGIYDVPFRETLFTGKVTTAVNAVSLRVAPLRARQQFAADRRRSQSGAIILGDEQQHVRFGEREPQLGRRPVDPE